MDTNCQQVSQNYRDLYRAYQKVTESGHQFIENPFASPLQEREKAFEQLMTNFDAEGEGYLEDFKEKVRTLLSHWVSDPEDNNRIDVEDDGRVSFFGHLNLVNSNRPFRNEYFPALIRKVDGTVFLHPSITQIDFLEEVENLAYRFPGKPINTDFSAKRLKVTHENNGFTGTINLESVHGEVLLPSLKTTFNLFAQNATKVVASNLEEAQGITIGGGGDLTSLTKVGDLELGRGMYNVSNLEGAGSIIIGKDVIGDFQKMMNVWTIVLEDTSYTRSFRDYFPNLGQADHIRIKNAKMYSEIEELKKKGFRCDDIQFIEE